MLEVHFILRKTTQINRNLSQKFVFKNTCRKTFNILEFCYKIISFLGTVNQT